MLKHIPFGAIILRNRTHSSITIADLPERLIATDD